MDATIRSAINIGGVAINSTTTRSEESAVTYSDTLAAGTSGTLSTRTDDNTGVVTASGHGLSVSDTVDVYWTGGVRYGMNVTAVSGDDVTVDAGSGDVLPAQATAVVICEAVEINMDFDGDDMAMLAIGCNKRAHLDFQDSASASLFAIEITADEPYRWSNDQEHTRPITGNAVDKVLISNGTTAAGTLKVGALLSAN